MTTPLHEEIDPIIDALAKTNWTDVGRRLKTACDRDLRGGPVGVDGYPTGNGGPGPTNAVSRPTESAVLANYRTAREDPTARVCPNGCDAPFDIVADEGPAHPYEDDIGDEPDDAETSDRRPPGVYCTRCSSATVLRDADGPQGAGIFVTARDPLRDVLTLAWKHLQTLAVAHQAVVDQMAKIDELDTGATSPPMCQPCERAGRMAPMGVYGDVGGRLPEPERLCIWHHRWIWRHNAPIAKRGDDVDASYPPIAAVHRHHGAPPATPVKRTKPKPPDPKADIAHRRHKRITEPQPQIGD